MKPLIMVSLIFPEKLLGSKVSGECDSGNAEAGEGALEAVEAGEGACVSPVFTVAM